MLLLATGVAVLHGLAIVVMLTGSLVAVRHPTVLLVHVPLALAILAVNLAGADCPLTTLELALREEAGAAPYRGGYLGHYVLEPLGLDVAASGSQLGIHATALGLNAVGYGMLAARAVRASRTSAPARGRRRCAPRRRTPEPPAAAHRAGRRTSSRTAAPALR